MTDHTTSANGTTFSRRDFVNTSAATALMATSFKNISTPAWGATSPDLTWMQGSQLLELMASKALSPVEVTQHFLDRIERLDPKIHAYITVDAEGALAQAKAAEAAVIKGDPLGPLHGLPISLKDLVATKNLRSTDGSAVYRDNIPTRDEIQVERLRAAGAIILGKTNTSEFGMFSRTRTLLAGETLNPWNTNHITGASSGGAGAAVAAGISCFAIGSDGGGSTRIPSCFNGVFGFHPSAGRIPMRKPRNTVMSSTGPMTLYVRDAAAILGVVSGFDPRDPSSIEQPAPNFVGELNSGVEGLRIAWTRDFGKFPIINAQVVDQIEATVKKFTDAGAHVETPEMVLPDESWMTFRTINETSYHRIGKLTSLSPEQRAQLTPPIAEMLKQAETMLPIPVEQEMLALENRALSQKWIDTIFAKHDLICTPMFSFGAPPIPEGWEQPYEDPIFAKHISTCYTYIANVLGLPAASVPCGFIDGLPIALQIIGPRFEDVRVMRAAHAMSILQPWMDKHPQIAL